MTAERSNDDNHALPPAVGVPIGYEPSVQPRFGHHTFDGERAHGTTVSAFCSLSMTPPMILVALDKGSDLLSMVQRTGTFGVNVLSASQSRIATRFAVKGANKFDGVEWVPENGAARLPATASWVACTVDTIVPGGDHFVLLGEVVAADTTDAPPLTYHSGSFGTHREDIRP